MTWGPMRGLKKLHGKGTSNRQTDTRTLRQLDQLGPDGRVGENALYGAHTERTTHGHGDSMNKSAQWGQFIEK